MSEEFRESERNILKSVLVITIPGHLILTASALRVHIWLDKGLQQRLRGSSRELAKNRTQNPRKSKWCLRTTV